MKVIFFLTFLILLFPNCNHGYEFWDISKFSIVDSALKDQEEIKLLYSSRGPDNNDDLKYYIQIVAVSQKTGDTVNILTTVNNGFSMDDKNKVFNYFDQNSIVSKTFQNNSTKLKEIKRVARDPTFDNIADNEFPTVIGTIGTVEK